MAGIELRNIQKSYGDVDAIRDVSLKIKEGEFVVLVGPSGCGKSTLLRCIAGLEPVTSGHIYMDGIDVTTAAPVARGVAMVFQSYALYPHMTVAQNIGFGLKIAGEAKPAIQARVLEIAKLLKLDTLLSRKPKALSGGQRQRVAIGRALARKPRIFLFDEPLSNLDASLRAEMRVELVKLHNQLGNTMIYVTHDQVEGMTLADAMVVMNASAVEQSGAPLDLFNRPNNKFVARFLGQPPINFIRTSETSREGGTLLLGLPGGERLAIPDATSAAQDLEGLEIGIRPEDLTVSTGGNGLRLTLDVVEQLGNETILYGHLVDKQPVTVRLAGQSKFRSSQELRLGLSAERVLLFDRQGMTVRMNGR